MTANGRRSEREVGMAPFASTCLAPGQSVSRDSASLFGSLAETTIAMFYLRHRQKAAFFPLTSDDFQDVSGGVSNVTLYLTFLKAKNPRLSSSQLLDLRRRIGGGQKGSFVKVPDLLTDDGTIREFYEIKPNSPTGVADGIEKLTKIGALMGFVNLPYVPGTKFSPDKKVLSFKGIMFEIEVKVFFIFSDCNQDLSSTRSVWKLVWR
jgi:hypothetical protein